MIKIKRGLDIPLAGAPALQISSVSAIRSVAILGGDYPGVTPTMKVVEGERVLRGQVLFSDKRCPRVLFTSPVSGFVRAINRGARRQFQSVVIDIEPGAEDAIDFRSYNRAQIQNMDRESAIEQLLQSGLWTAIRTRPFSRIADPDSTPHAVFVNAMDTNPLSADPSVIIRDEQKAFDDGLALVGRLAPKLYVCRKAGADFTTGAFNPHEFDGPHPAGLVGTHIHFLEPVSGRKTVWHLNYQDVIAIGKLFATGQLDSSRVVSLAGPAVKQPRLVKTWLGASLQDLTTGELNGSNNRIVSGSALSGRTAQGVEAWLGRYHLQVTVLSEGTEREFIHYLRPGVNRFSKLGIYAGKLVRKAFPMTTSTNGSPRAMVPVGVYEEVMPLDILPTPLLRYLIVGDTDMAQALGCLELDEEDLGLCTFVCPGKYEYGPILRDVLDRIEKEG